MQTIEQICKRLVSSTEKCHLGFPHSGWGHNPTLSELEPLVRRIIEISYKYKTGHLSSNLTALPILYRLCQDKDAKTVLSAGHMGIALYSILEAFEGKDAEGLYAKHGTHPNRDIANGIYCSSGSLGLGMSIAAGMAWARPQSHINCLISDGECAEGIVWEVLRITCDMPIDNISIVVNANGSSAIDLVNINNLYDRLVAFNPNVIIFKTPRELFGVLDGIEEHYHVLTDDEYRLLEGGNNA